MFETSTSSIEGVLELGTPTGPTCPPGSELMIAETSIYQLFRPFEGKRVLVTLTVLDDGPMPRKGPGTIRDLTAPRH